MTAPITSSPPGSSDSAGWAVILAILTGVVLLEWRAPLPIAISGLASLAGACLALGGAATFYRLVRHRENFAVMCLALMQVLLFSTAGAILSYLLAREGGALWDGRFGAWDRALGFDWLAYVRWVDAHGWLTLGLRWAYASLIPQMVVIVVALGFTLRLAELRTTMLAAMISGTVTIILSPLFPAVSNFVQLGLTAADFRHVDPWAGYVHLDHFTALREGGMSVLNLSDMQGIITFPSYHAALATVTLWGFLQCGPAWLRWPGAALALATIVATPVDGGHYLVDVLAGSAVALASIAVARWAIYWRPDLEPLKAWPSRHSRAAFGR